MRRGLRRGEGQARPALDVAEEGQAAKEAEAGGDAAGAGSPEHEGREPVPTRRARGALGAAPLQRAPPCHWLATSTSAWYFAEFCWLSTSSAPHEPCFPGP